MRLCAQGSECAGSGTHKNGGGREIRKPKSEDRRKAEIRNPNLELRLESFFGVRHGDFGLHTLTPCGAGDSSSSRRRSDWQKLMNHGLRRLSSGGSAGRGTFMMSTRRPGLGAIKNTRSPR